jgi:hypothetical protein
VVPSEAQKAWAGHAAVLRRPQPTGAAIRNIDSTRTILRDGTKLRPRGTLSGLVAFPSNVTSDGSPKCNG